MSDKSTNCHTQVPRKVSSTEQGGIMKTKTKMENSECGTNEMFHVNVGGYHYEINKQTMLSVDGSRMQTLSQKGTHDENEVFFERPRMAFEAILAYHQTGQLHMPGDMCVGAFKREMEFWGINPHVMENCCYHRYVTFVREQDILNGFLTKTKKAEECLDNLLSDQSSKWARLRSRIWTVLDNKDNSILTQVYFSVATAFILMAIFATALGTLSSTEVATNTSVDIEPNNCTSVETIEGCAGDECTATTRPPVGTTEECADDECTTTSRPPVSGRNVNFRGRRKRSEKSTRPLQISEYNQNNQEMLGEPLQQQMVETDQDPYGGNGRDIYRGRLGGDAGYDMARKRMQVNGIVVEEVISPDNGNVYLHQAQKNGLKNGPGYLNNEADIDLGKQNLVDSTRVPLHQGRHDTERYNPRSISIRENTVDNEVGNHDDITRDRHEGNFAHSTGLLESVAVESVDRVLTYHSQTLSDQGNLASRQVSNAHEKKPTRMRRSVSMERNTTVNDGNFTSNIENTTADNGNVTSDLTNRSRNSTSDTNTLHNETNQTQAALSNETIRNMSLFDMNVTDTNDFDTGNGSFVNGSLMRGGIKLFGFRDINSVRDVIDTILPEAPTAKLLTLETATDVEQMVYMYIEYATNVFFTAELFLRLLCCPRSRKHIFSFQNIIDMIVLAAVYTRSLLYLCYLEDYQNDIDVLLYLQMLRVLRLLRLLENVTAYKVLCYSMRVGKKDIFLMLLYVLIGVLFFSNFIYFVERNEDFPSIPDAWWWSLVTMTTVGYGDMVPKTFLGKIIGSICAISGVFMFSLIIPIFVNTFLSIYQYAEVHNRDHDMLHGIEIKKHRHSTIKEEAV